MALVCGAQAACKPLQQTRLIDDEKADVGEVSAAPTADQKHAGTLIDTAKWIGDLDNLVRLLAKGLSGAKPWQLQFAAQVAEIERLMQVFRLLIALESRMLRSSRLRWICR